VQGVRRGIVWRVLTCPGRAVMWVVAIYPFLSNITKLLYIKHQAQLVGEVRRCGGARAHSPLNMRIPMTHSTPAIRESPDAMIEKAGT